MHLIEIFMFQAPEKPTHATLYVAKTYPPWQCTVLSTLKEMYDQAGPNGPQPDNKILSQKLSAMPELKKWMKKVMPFVAFAKERVAEQVKFCKCFRISQNTQWTLNEIVNTFNGTFTG